MSIGSITKLGGIAVIALIVLTLFGGSWYRVDQTERGVILRNGAIIGTAQPGLNFKTPWLESVVKVDMQNRTVVWRKEHDGADYSMQAYSQDQQPASMVVSVVYHVPPDKVAELYSEYTNVENLESRLINRRTPQAVKTTFGQYTAVSVIQDRAKFNDAVQKAVKDAIVGPVVIDTVQVENIDFSDAYENAVEQAMTARVEVQKRQQLQQQEEISAKIAVIQAQGRADSVIAEAKAKAQSVILAGDAEAKAIAAKGDALSKNPALVTLTAAEKWDGKLPVTMVPGNAVPFVNLPTTK